MAEATQARPVTPETIAAQAAQIEEAEDKSGGAKHFDQPGVRFSFQELRDEELARKTQTGESFRQHVEVALLTLRALNGLNDKDFGEFRKEIKFNEWDGQNKHKKDQLIGWLKQVQSGARTGGGASAAAAAREAALRKEVEELKALLKQQNAAKAK